MRYYDDGTTYHFDGFWGFALFMFATQKKFLLKRMVPFFTAFATVRILDNITHWPRLLELSSAGVELLAVLIALLVAALAALANVWGMWDRGFKEKLITKGRR